MVQLYVSDTVSRISFIDNRVVVWSEDHGESHFPVETLDGITLFGRPTMTTPFIFEMLKRALDIQLFSTDGHYKGRITAPVATHAPRIRAQVHCADDPAFCLALSKRIVAAKIRHQEALVTAHATGRSGVPEFVHAMRHSLGWVDRSGSLSELNGFEGNAAKAYFAALRLLVPEEFAFNARITRPPTDAFNSMLSLGYSLLYKNIIGAIERHSLNPYIGFLHQDSRGHATLASDLMEVWRSPLVDDTVLRLIGEGLVRPDAFTKNPDTGGVYATRETTRSIVRAIGNRIARAATYIAGDSHKYTFQYALDLQLQSLVRAIESRTPSLLIEIDISSVPQGTMDAAGKS
ncbi:CRISPR-associated endonuclease Cas1 [Mycobacterium heckeshornense]|uniref:CRISPR-associated endonuclease Cas1 n=1 Tax=Mycobacterium heckeshornense TaxID=110505 RepID=UPI0019431104|nr:CRISPR-associated endonuclease Cas1 [Mycobacterium heckeshornense]BCQ10562.1 CRISPR-associated endonuclease Cas1 [Mycobacterium heckeshornense]